MALVSATIFGIRGNHRTNNDFQSTFWDFENGQDEVEVKEHDWIPGTKTRSRCSWKCEWFTESE